MVVATARQHLAAGLSVDPGMKEQRVGGFLVERKGRERCVEIFRRGGAKRLERLIRGDGAFTHRTMRQGAVGESVWNLAVSVAVGPTVALGINVVIIGIWALRVAVRDGPRAVLLCRLGMCERMSADGVGA